MKPPYEITGKILRLISLISEKIGEVKSARLVKPPAQLRKKNRIKTIQSTLQIEGNTLTIEQITDLINHKKVIAPRKDIVEVKNAIQVYQNLDEFNVFHIDSMRSAHKMLMHTLIEEPGKLRTSEVGIVKGDDLKHMAPPARMVPQLLNDLFNYLKEDDDVFLLKSCVFHYEFEFIHPFVDGNGRMGRLWQTLILREYSPIFEFLPIESLVKEQQQAYYNVLEKSDNSGTSTPFIEFMLNIIHTALEELLHTQKVQATAEDRVQIFRNFIGKAMFSRKDYLRQNKDISSATASRDLKNAVNEGILLKIGDKRMAKYQFTSGV